MHCSLFLVSLYLGALIFLAVSTQSARSEIPGYFSRFHSSIKREHLRKRSASSNDTERLYHFDYDDSLANFSLAQEGSSGGEAVNDGDAQRHDNQLGGISYDNTEKSSASEVFPEIKEKKFSKQLNVTRNSEPTREYSTGFFICNLWIIFCVGFFGNLLTLTALPYVRYEYKSEFSSLNSSSYTLLLHLSLCDFLYCTVGITHFIWRYYIILGDPDYEPDPALCHGIGLFRNLTAWADIITLAVVSVSVAYHNFCRKCRDQGLMSDHRKHDVIFGGWRVYVVCLAIWFSAFLVINQEIFGIGGQVL